MLSCGMFFLLDVVLLDIVLLDVVLLDAGLLNGSFCPRRIDRLYT